MIKPLSRILNSFPEPEPSSGSPLPSPTEFQPEFRTRGLTNNKIVHRLLQIVNRLVLVIKSYMG